jgi:hypothetical protein
MVGGTTASQSKSQTLYGSRTTRTLRTLCTLATLGAVNSPARSIARGGASRGASPLGGASSGGAESPAAEDVFVLSGSRGASPRSTPAARSARCRQFELVDGIQRIYDGRWDPSKESEENKSEQVRQCMDLQHCLHTGYTWSPLTSTFAGLRSACTIDICSR